MLFVAMNFTNALFCLVANGGNFIGPGLAQDISTNLYSINGRLTNFGSFAVNY